MAILARINPLRAFLDGRRIKGRMKFSDYLNQDHVLFLEASTRDEALNTLIDRLDDQGILPDSASFRSAIYHREGLVSTGIGAGVAIPHARMSAYEDFFLAIGIQQKQGLEWGALDKVPVRLIFLIGGPDDEQADYLQLLSSLTHMVRNADLRKKLLQAAKSEDVVRLLSVHAS